jgi:hypothetical protein
VRPISPIDRCHYTISPMVGWATPPSTCPAETQADEQHAAELGAQSLETLPRDARLRLDALWETADREMKRREFSFGEARDALGALFESRVVLITTDQQLQKAGASVVRLVNTMMDESHRRGFHLLHEVDLNEALFNLHPLFPFTE